MINLTPTLMETMAAINAQVNADAAWPDHAVKSDPIGGWLNPAAPEWDETAAAEKRRRLVAAGIGADGLYLAIATDRVVLTADVSEPEAAQTYVLSDLTDAVQAWADAPPIEARESASGEWIRLA
jgi:predicted transglutaminase-like cysteine proteinase